MKRSVAFSFLSALFVKLSVVCSEFAIDDDNWANDEMFPNTYSEFDPASTSDDGFQGSMWDENLITDADPNTGPLADADTGCFGKIEPSSKRRREDFCDPRAEPGLASPQTSLESPEQKDRINLDLEPVRFPGGLLHFTQMDLIYCGNHQFVVCDSARENDKTPNGNGKYRLQNVRRGMIPFSYVGPCIVSL